MAKIDTLKYYRDLKAGGISDEQAEAEIRALQSVLDELPTKEDLKTELNSLAININNKINSVETRLNVKIEYIETSLNTRIDHIEFSLNTKIDQIETSLNTKTAHMEASLNTKIDSMKTIGWAIFAVWLAVVMPVFKMAFFS